MRGASLCCVRLLALLAPPPEEARAEDLPLREVQSPESRAPAQPSSEQSSSQQPSSQQPSSEQSSSQQPSPPQQSQAAQTPASRLSPMSAQAMPSPSALGLSDSDADTQARQEPGAAPRSVGQRLRHYLAQPRVASDVMLPHGALGIGAAGGWPDLYRLTLGIGLLDHLSLGLDAHWLPEQRVPQVAPRVALAAFRGERFEAGLEYHQRLYSPPSLLAQGEQFQQRDHFGGVFATFGLGWVSASGSLGAMAFRERNPAASAPATDYVERVRIAGGLRIRVGDERWGLILRGEMPVASLSFGFELRFGLFGQRALIGRPGKRLPPGRARSQGALAGQASR